MSREKIEEMGKLCPFHEEGKCNLLEDEAVECNFDCDMCDFAKNLYNAGYRKQSEPISCGHENGGEWISVDERLPDGNGSFLTVDEKGHMEVCYWEKRFGWFASSCNKNALTHWMPLPEAPKMKGGAE